jgi:hypothetical protein
MADSDLQARVSELPLATAANDTDEFEVSQGATSRRMPLPLLRAGVAQDLSGYLRGIVGGAGIVIAGGAPVPTVELETVGGAGQYGDATHVPQIVIDAYGRVTGVLLIPINVSGGNWAPLDSPHFTGSPTAPTQVHGTKDTTLANAAFVVQEIAAIDLSPYAPKNSPQLTGNPVAPTPPPATTDNSIATAAFVKTAIVAIPPLDLSAYAPLNSPGLTGKPTTPTPVPATADTTIVNAAFVKAAVAAGAPTALSNAIPSNIPTGAINAWGNGPSVGPFGVAGEKWRIDVGLFFGNNPSQYEFFAARVWNGTAAVLPTVGGWVASSINGNNTFFGGSGILTLTGPTTLTLQAQDVNSANGYLVNGSWITAQKVT